MIYRVMNTATGEIGADLLGGNRELAERLAAVLRDIDRDKGDPSPEAWAVVEIGKSKDNAGLPAIE